MITKESKKTTEKYLTYLTNIHPSLFTVLFLLFSGYLLLTKIESNDLWWHLACGRYLFENGSYPPPGTFTFSPVTQSTSNAHTWLGDLFLYCIHYFLKGDTGLQLFRITIICFPVFVFIRLTKKSYNTWSLLGSIAIVMGTYQQNLLRNSIFAMFYLPLMILLWHLAIKKRNFKWLLPYPVILLLWTHMHGYAIVGLSILALFFAGELIDQIIKKNNRNFRFLLVLMIILGGSWKIVHVNWNVNPLGIVQNIQTTIFQGTKTNVSSADYNTKKINSTQKHVQIDTTFKERFIKLKNRVKMIFRPFLKGGDADTVMEFVSPFDAYAILPAKAFFLFSLFYFGYLSLALMLDPKGLRASYVLPSLASIFLGFGYVRTLAFPFLVALPLMATHIPDISKRMADSENRLFVFMRKTTPWLVLCACIPIVYNFYAADISHIFYFFGLNRFSGSISSLCINYKSIIFTVICIAVTFQVIFASGFFKNKANNQKISIIIFFGVIIVSLNIFLPPDIFFDHPLRFVASFSIVPFILFGIWQLNPECREKYYFHYSRFLFWLLPLIFCVQFALTAHFHFHEKTFYKITKIFIREPGLGKNSKFRDAMPDHILETFPDEKIFNSYNTGGYLIWKWYNRKKVFIDSRSITYAKDFYDDYNYNHGFGYLDSFGINKSLFNLSTDTKYINAYLNHNWAVLTFDVNTVLLKKGNQQGYKSTYGIIPDYLGTTEDIDLLSKYKLWDLGAFIDNTLRSMLLHGRLSDAIQWSYKTRQLIEKLPLKLQQSIQEKISFMTMLEGHFGRINNNVLATVCQTIDSDGTPVSQNMALGEAYLAFNRKNAAASMYIAAAALKPDDVNLQKKVGNLLFQMSFVDQAINQYLKIVSLKPDMVDDYITLAYLYASKKEYDQSEKYLRKVLANAPKHAKVHLNLGLVLSAKGETEAAIDIYKNGLSLFPGELRLTEELSKLEQQKL